MSENRDNKLSVKVREVLGDKSKLGFSENPKRMITGVGLLSLAGGDYKQNEQLMYELEQRNKDLLAYRCMYASAYDGFEETK